MRPAHRFDTQPGSLHSSPMLPPVLILTIALISSPHGPLPPPVQVLTQFEAASDQVRRSAVETYSKGCRDRRARMRYRKQAGALSRFERAATDPAPQVRRAAVAMATCFGPQKSAPALSKLVADSDATTSLKAMNQVADFSDASTTAAMITWLTKHRARCMAPGDDEREHCIFALYATGQSARREPRESKLKLGAAKALLPFLSSDVPKAREVSAVALSFVGGHSDAEPIMELVEKEKQGSFSLVNSAEVIAQLHGIARQLSQTSESR